MGRFGLRSACYGTIREFEFDRINKAKISYIEITIERFP